MNDNASATWTSVGRKLISGLTGVLLVLYVILHLAGNLTLLARDPDVFNGYAHFLEELGHGALLPVAEVILIAIFLFHIASGIAVAQNKRRARRDGYHQSGNAGGPSHKTVSSRTMIFTGLILMCFVIVHVYDFRLTHGHDIPAPGGGTMRDLYSLVWAKFQNGGYVAFYVGSMLLLGLHLRHGFWSMFQSLGAMNPRLSPAVNTLGVFIAVVLAFGFLMLPILVYTNAVHPSVTAAASALGQGVAR